MTVGSSGSAQQAQMRNMHGAGGVGNGGGNGNGGMRDIMQSLSQEDRTQLRDEMSSLSGKDRQSAIAQMKKVDNTNMNDQEYFQSLLDILNQNNATASKASTEGLPAYA
ncbi:MAG: hypothetical protein QM482_09825 [Sulfurospirillum sp.]